MAPAHALSRRALMIALACVASMLAFTLITATAARADVEGDVWVTTDGPNRLDLWTLANDSSVQHKYWIDGSGWSAWENLGGQVFSEPTAVEFPDGRYAVYARGPGDTMWVKTWFPPGHATGAPGWTGWGNIGGATYRSAITTALSNNGSAANLVGRDANNNVFVRDWTAAGGWVHDGTVAGPISYAPTMLNWTPPGRSASQGDLFAVGADGQVERNTYKNSQWSGWAPIGGAASSSPTVDYGDNQLTVAVRGTNDGVSVNGNHGGDDSDGRNGWTGWQSIGGSIATAPTIHYWPRADGSARWIVVGRNNADSAAGRPSQVTMNEFSDNAWKGWTAISSTPDSPYYSTDVAYGTGGTLSTRVDQDKAGEAIAAISRQYIADYMWNDGVTPSERGAVAQAYRRAKLLQDSGDVDITTDGPNRIDLWTMGPNGSVVHKNWIDGAGWSDWENLEFPTYIKSPPTAVRFPDGHYAVYVRGSDDALWTKNFYPGQGWDEAWVEQDATIRYSSSIQVAYSGPGASSVNVVGRGLDNGLISRVWSTGSGWSGADHQPGPIYTAPVIVDWIPSNSSVINADVFAVGPDENVLENYNLNLHWSGWEPIAAGADGGLPSTQVYGDTGNDQLWLVTRGPNSPNATVNLWRPGRAWAGWSSIGGNLSTAPNIAYWPKPDGTPRWIVVARDKGDPTIDRDPQLVTAFGQWGSFGAWAGLTPAPGARTNYASSSHFDVDNHDGHIDTEHEIRTAVSELRDDEPFLRDNGVAGIDPANGERAAVEYALDMAMHHTSSYAYGGGDFRVNTQSDYDALFSVIDGTNDDGFAATVYGDLNPADLAGVDAAFRARIHDGDIVHDMTTSRSYYYANGTVNYITPGFAGPAGLDLTTARRVPASVLASWTMGPDTAYPTSWRYGGSDHSVNTDAEANALLPLLSGNGGADARPLLDGLSVADNAWLKNNYLVPAITGGPSPSGAALPTSQMTAPPVFDPDDDDAHAARSATCQKEQNFKIGFYRGSTPRVQLRWDVLYCSANDGTIYNIHTSYVGSSTGYGWQTYGALQRGGQVDATHHNYHRIFSQQYQLCGGSSYGVNLDGTGISQASNGCLTGTLTMDRTVYFGLLWHPNPDDSTVFENKIQDRSDPVGPCSGGSCKF